MIPEIRKLEIKIAPPYFKNLKYIDKTGFTLDNSDVLSKRVLKLLLIGILWQQGQWRVSGVMSSISSPNF